MFDRRRRDEHQCRSPVCAAHQRSSSRHDRDGTAAEGGHHSRPGRAFRHAPCPCRCSPGPKIVVENADGLVDGGEPIVDPLSATLRETHKIAGVDTRTNEVTLKERSSNPRGRRDRSCARPVRAVSISGGKRGAGRGPPQPQRRSGAVPDISARCLEQRVQASLRRRSRWRRPLRGRRSARCTLIGGRDPGSIDYPYWYTGYDGRISFRRSAGPERYGLASLESKEEIDLVALPDLAGQALPPSAIRPAASRSSAAIARSFSTLPSRRPPGADRYAPEHHCPRTAVSIPQQLSDPLTTSSAPLLSVATVAMANPSGWSRLPASSPA